MSVEPALSEFKINDTIWVSSNFSDSIEEFYSKKNYRISDFDFNITIGMRSLISNTNLLSQQPGAIESFRIFAESGDIVSPRETFIGLKYAYNNNSYICRIGVIPTKKGVFCINFFCPISLDLRQVIPVHPGPNGKPRTAAYEDLFVIVNSGETNFELFQQHCLAGSVINPYTANIYHEQKGTYTFRVIE